jgi:hypothetical protein
LQFPQRRKIMARVLTVSAADTSRHTARLRIPAQRQLQDLLQHTSNPASRKNKPGSRKNKLAPTAT